MTTSKKIKMEDDLKRNKNGRLPKQKNGRQPQKKGGERKMTSTKIEDDL